METTELDDGAPEVLRWEVERLRLGQCFEQAARALFAHTGSEQVAFELAPGVSLVARIEHA